MCILCSLSLIIKQKWKKKKNIALNQYKPKQRAGVCVTTICVQKVQILSRLAPLIQLSVHHSGINGTDVLVLQCAIHFVPLY